MSNIDPKNITNDNDYLEYCNLMKLKYNEILFENKKLKQKIEHYRPRYSYMIELNRFNKRKINLNKKYNLLNERYQILDNIINVLNDNNNLGQLRRLRCFSCISNRIRDINLDNISIGELVRKNRLIKLRYIKLRNY